ncbi:MAG: PQQ-binding-like beta-propeller repeat protein, partial [Myxococcota bacterium]
MQAWAHDAGSVIESTPTVVDGLVLVGTFAGALQALDVRTGSPRWAYETGGQKLRASVSVLGGVAYFGADDDVFRAVDIADGRERWRLALGPGGEQSSPALVEDVVV